MKPQSILLHTTSGGNFELWVIYPHSRTLAFSAGGWLGIELVRKLAATVALNYGLPPAAIVED